MKFTYVSRDVSFTTSMKEMVEEKLAKFDSYFRADSEVDAVITISILPNHLKAVEISLSTTGVDLRVKTMNEDYYSAIDTLITKLEGQMRKMKTQLQRVNKRRSLSENILMEQIEEDQKEAKVIVKRKHLSLAPMDVDEAIARMDALGHKFFIYLDSATDKVNVIYERDDGTFGDIEVEK
jgi:ribosomal subunit interface protein